jgi:hypothetical protein
VGDYLAMVGYGKDAGAGYYILQATSRAYQLEADVTEDGLFDEDGRPWSFRKEASSSTPCT